jgi:hypothetical protein
LEGRKGKQDSAQKGEKHGFLHGDARPAQAYVAVWRVWNDVWVSGFPA